TETPLEGEETYAEVTTFESEAPVEGEYTSESRAGRVGGPHPAPRRGGRFIDGGVRSSTNADLATGYGTVVIVAPISVGGGPVPSARTQAARLAAAGARVVLITPDRAARRAFGRNVLDPARRAPSARAGRAQAVAHADAVRAVLPV
ncbi:patatin-like phospholipase family protein, partial [Streptomyces sp. NPDC059013]